MLVCSRFASNDQIEYNDNFTNVKIKQLVSMRNSEKGGFQYGIRFRSMGRQ